MINIRQGTIEDFKKLDKPWAWGKSKWQREAQKNYIEGITKGTQEFLVVEDGNKILGEIHIFWDKPKDHDEADGKKRAYLCAMRIHPDSRGQGLGTKLMEVALKRIKENGFTESTIGAYVDEIKNQELYKKWGFTELVKETWEKTSEYRAKYFLYLQKLT